MCDFAKNSKVNRYSSSDNLKNTTSLFDIFSQSKPNDVILIVSNVIAFENDQHCVLFERLK